MTFTAKQKGECAAREVGYRKRVYARRVAAEQMTQAKADAEIAIMQEIADDYRRLAEVEEPRLI